MPTDNYRRANRLTGLESTGWQWRRARQRRLTVAAGDSGLPEGPPVTPGKVWPSAPARYWALFVIVLATFMSFLDQVVFGMLAENIKRDFRPD